MVCNGANSAQYTISIQYLVAQSNQSPFLSIISSNSLVYTSDRSHMVHWPSLKIIHPIKEVIQRNVKLISVTSTTCPHKYSTLSFTDVSDLTMSQWPHQHLKFQDLVCTTSSLPPSLCFWHILCSPQSKHSTYSQGNCTWTCANKPRLTKMLSVRHA